MTKTKPVPVVVVDASPDDSCNEDDRALDLVAETSEAAAAAESEEDSEEDSEEESEEEGDADPQDEKEQKKLRKKARNDADKQRLCVQPLVSSIESGSWTERSSPRFQGPGAFRPFPY